MHECVVVWCVINLLAVAYLLLQILDLLFKKIQLLTLAQYVLNVIDVETVVAGEVCGRERRAQSREWE